MSEERKSTENKEKTAETYLYYRRSLSFLSEADEKLADAVLFFKHANEVGEWQEQEGGVSHKDALVVYLYSFEKSIEKMKSLINIEDFDKYMDDRVAEMKEGISNELVHVLKNNVLGDEVKKDFDIN